MFRLFSLLLIVIGTGCVNFAKYRHQDIIEEKKDIHGRTIYKKFTQLISHPAHDKIATITQEYDSLGRVTKEYGFNHPYYYNTKYLMEKIYWGSQVYVMNKFLWDKTDTSQDFSNYNTKIYQQAIFPDSNNRNKTINVSLSLKENGIYYGNFSETFPVSINAATVDLFSFELDIKNISFDKNRRLILDSIRRKN